jgi:hypothetical protein
MYKENFEKNLHPNALNETKRIRKMSGMKLSEKKPNENAHFRIRQQVAYRNFAHLGEFLNQTKNYSDSKSSY